MQQFIDIQNLSIRYSKKLCFEGFSHQILCGDRIAIIGDNGVGKSSLLKAIYEQQDYVEGQISKSSDLQLSYLPQLLISENQLSGGQQLMQTLDELLTQCPEVLLLDEPSNHLDEKNREKLYQTIQYFYGAVIAVTHDIDLIDHCFDQIWDIHQQKITVFKGNYKDYKHAKDIEHQTLNQQLLQLKKQQKQLHKKVESEKQRAAKSAAKGKKSITNKKWPTVVSKAKLGRANSYSNQMLKDMHQQQQSIHQHLRDLNIAELIKPRFDLEHQQAFNVLVSVNDGSLAYGDNVVLNNINVQIHATEQLLIKGDNGAGKSTFIKALLDDDALTKLGHWDVLPQKHIIYVDQHYSLLQDSQTVFEHIQAMNGDWDQTKIYHHLADFLFRGSEAVQQCVATLSGGEKVRLLLAMIAAHPPKLLILDEITNNLDMQTIEHLIHVLQHYSGCLMVITHHPYLINALNLSRTFLCKEGGFIEL